MSYRRIIPRDLFNEANLLKCLGALYILLQWRIDGAGFDVEDVDRFDVEQNEADGSIYVANLPFSIGGTFYHLFRPLNSREPWPLYMTSADGSDFDVVSVFEKDGSLSERFLALLPNK
jgi:hypothetical protein